jgi:hypothetical protein
MKLLLFLSLFFLSSTIAAQVNYHELGRKSIYYGMQLGVNAGDLNVKRKMIMPATDSIRSIDTKVGPGFNVGIVGNWQFQKYFDLRLIPSLIFTERNLIVTHTNGYEEVKNIPSIYVSAPLLLRIKSEPVKDFRITVLGGIRYDFDMASSKGSTYNGEGIRLQKHDISVEYGIGCQIYFPYFILAPEFKMSHSLLNIKAAEQSPTNNNLIEGLFQRTFTLVFNFEG